MFEIILVLLIFFAIFVPRSDGSKQVLVHAHLPIKIIWSDPKFKSQYFFHNDENPTIELQQYIWTPAQPQIGATYKFLDTNVEVEKLRFEYPNEWEVRAKQVDTSRCPLRDDSELCEELMTYIFEKGWEMPLGEWGGWLKMEMEKHPKYFDKCREFLKKRLAFVKIYKEHSFGFWAYWKEKSFNAELKRAISDAYLCWSLMPESEREKLPEGYKKIYERLIGKK